MGLGDRLLNELITLDTRIASREEELATVETWLSAPTCRTHPDVRHLRHADRHGGEAAPSQRAGVPRGREVAVHAGPPRAPEAGASGGGERPGGQDRGRAGATCARWRRSRGGGPSVGPRSGKYQELQAQNPTIAQDDVSDPDPRARAVHPRRPLRGHHGPQGAVPHHGGDGPEPPERRHRVEGGRSGRAGRAGRQHAVRLRVVHDLLRRDARS